MIMEALIGSLILLLIGGVIIGMAIYLAGLAEQFDQSERDQMMDWEDWDDPNYLRF